MPTNDPNNPLGFEIEVTGEDNLRKSISKGEAAYLRFSKSIGKTVTQLRNQVKKHADAIKSSKKHRAELRSSSQLAEAYHRGEIKNLREARKEYVRYQKEQNKFNKSVRSIEKQGFLANAFGKAKEAANDLGLSAGRLAGIIGGATLLGALASAAKSFLEWDNKVRSLNVSLSSMPITMSAMNDSIELTAARLGIAAEEGINVAKAMGEVRLIARDSAKDAARFKQLSTTILEMSVSMEVASGEVVDLFDKFTKVYNLPHHRLRGIGSAMKFIQETTSLSGQEVLTLGKSLEELSSRMTGSSGEARADMVRDFTAIAGVLKDSGVEATQFPGLFSEALKIDSENGQQWLAFVSQQTGRGMESIRRMISSGDVESATQLFITALKKLGPEGLREQESFMTGITSMNFTTLRKLMDVNQDAFTELIARAKVAERNRNLLAKSAEEMQSELTRSLNKLRVRVGYVWRSIGKSVADAALIIMNTAQPLITSAIGKIQDAFAWFDTPEGRAATRDWMKKASVLVLALGKGMTWLTDTVAKAVQWWNKQDETTQNVILTIGGLTAALALAGPMLVKIVTTAKVLGSAFGIVGAKIMAVAAGLTALYVGARRVADWADKKQDEQLRRQSLAKTTSYEIKQSLNQEDRNSRIGSIRAMLSTSSTQGLLTNQGTINRNELAKRAMVISPGSDRYSTERRKKLVDQWSSSLQNLISAGGGKDVQEALRRRDRDIARSLGTTSVANSPSTSPSSVQSTTSVASPAPPKVGTSMKSPQEIIVNASSTSTDAILTDIRDLIKRNSSRAVAGTVHPSRASINATLGG